MNNDFKSRYLSTIIGLPWAFIQPATFVIVIWFAFTYGLRAGVSATGIAFAPWLLFGMVPWLFISQTMIVCSVSLMDYSYLIKKTKLPVQIIPLIKIFSGIIIHISLLIFVLLIAIIVFDIHPSIYWIQFPYYLFCMIVLLSGISWFISSINVFIKDMAHIVNILVTMLFWATPIIWPYTMLPGKLKYVALLNPFFYITEGYRYTFVEKRWFFEFPEMNLFFWTFTIIFFVVGAKTFQKLSPRFADEL